MFKQWRGEEKGFNLAARVTAWLCFIKKYTDLDYDSLEAFAAESPVLQLGALKLRTNPDRAAFYDPDENFVPNEPFPLSCYRSRINLSGNQLDDTEFLSSLVSISSLNLRKNNIKDLNGLRYLVSADTVNLSGNLIDDIRPLQALQSADKLYLSNNRLVNLKGLEQLRVVRWLDLDRNHLTSLDDLRSLQYAEEIEVKDTKITEIPERLSALGLTFKSKSIATMPNSGP